MEERWIHEDHTEGYGVRWKINRIIHEEQTKYQTLQIADTIQWGKALILDGNLQITDKDEFIYHEMIVHVGMNFHPDVKSVLIIGGGDGGTLREVLKHSKVQSVDMVEIDDRVVENCKEYFPQVSCGFNDKRCNLLIDDGIAYVKNTDKKYDMVIVDSSDPIGPAIGLYSEEFYQSIYKILNDDGIMVVQSESPIFYGDLFKSINKNIKAVYPAAYVYLATVPTYVSGPWSFMIGSKKYDPLDLTSDRQVLTGLKYYNEGIHHAAFVLPEYIADLLSR